MKWWKRLMGVVMGPKKRYFKKFPKNNHTDPCRKKS